MVATKKDYLINTGIVPLLQNRWGLTLPSAAIRQVHRLEDAFIAGVKSTIESANFDGSNARLVVRDETQINGAMKSLLRAESRPTINLDDTYFDGLGDIFYSTTRLTNPDDLGKTEQGPRLGFAPMDEQARALAKRFGPQEVVILDIGTYGGETLASEVERLIKAGVNVKAIYLATANRSALEKLTSGAESLREKQGIDVVVPPGNVFDYADWVELRDFVGVDGRKVMRELDGLPVPEFTPFRNQFLFMPYRENLKQWASIPTEHVANVKELCDKYAALLQRAIISAGYSAVLEPIRTNKSIVDGEATKSYLLDFKKRQGSE